MGKKRQNRSKRSLSSLPKGLVRRGGGGGSGGSGSNAGNINPFEDLSARQKRPKQMIHNRPISKPKTTKHTLESLQRRQTSLKSTLQVSTKKNAFVDRRIGQYDPTMSRDDQMLARLVRERSKQSKRTMKFQLNDEEYNNGNDGGFGGGGGGGRGALGGLLTHKGKPLDPNKSNDEVYLSSDDEDPTNRGDLEAVDTELHFGGGSLSKRNTASSGYGAYGSSGGGTDQYGNSSTADLSQIYSHRKTELDELIARKKLQKAERVHMKEQQADQIDKMDDTFGELSQLLRYRKNEPPPPKNQPKPQPTQEEIEMNDWQREMKALMMKPKSKATDRTKTPEEVAKEEAERLHELETKRMARMNGDFLSDDDFSDISSGDENDGDNDKKSSSKKKRRNKKVLQKLKKKSADGTSQNPDELSDSDDSDNDENKLEARFTADGLVYVDKTGRVVKKLGDDGDDDQDDEEDLSDDDKSDDSSDEGDDGDNDDDDGKESKPLTVGTRVRGNYRAAEQYEGHESWYDGVITKVYEKTKNGTTTMLYDVEYDDGDFEEDMIRENLRIVEQTPEEKKATKELAETEKVMLRKRQKAKQKAREEIPYVFEVPTTLDALHALIAKYASTGEDASKIIERIHKANSVRLDRRNGDKMQNFYDVLLRRFVAVGDAIYASGDGGEELGRFNQLSVITKVLYAMAQESPETAGAVWSRRLGIFQNSHAKRLRDAEFLHEDDEDDDEDHLITAWPTTGTFLLLRALGHIFPVTDRKHHVVTPAILLLGQMVAQTPILSMYDLVLGVLCSGLLLEYTKEAKRVAPEAMGFLSGVIRLFAPSDDTNHLAVPSLDAARRLEAFASLRERLSTDRDGAAMEIPPLSIEKENIFNTDYNTPAAILSTAFTFVERAATNIAGSFSVPSEQELFAEVSESLVSLRPKDDKAFPMALQRKVASTVSCVAKICPSGGRKPLTRRAGLSIQEAVVKTLAPRMQDPNKYSMSKDKGKKSVQAAIDRTRREYKREHKAISRELRMDAAIIESERRKDQERKNASARAKRQKNFAWLEGEQAAMNQQVRQGGGLLKGGGTGLARAKAATGKLGIKKGGKF